MTVIEPQPHVDEMKDGVTRDELDFSRLVSSEEIRGDDDEDTALLREMLGDATSYLLNHSWCAAILRGWFAFGVGGVAAIFLFEIQPSRSDVDRFLWVVVGDLPPAYLVVDESRTAAATLAAYVREMRIWVEAVRNGGSLDGVIPVAVPPTRENADRLASRLEFLEAELLPMESSLSWPA